MIYKLTFSDDAIKDIQKIRKSGNKALFRKLETLLTELKEHPYTGTGSPEQLKHKLSGYWSRRLSREHRLVYSVNEFKISVNIVSTLGHYEK